MMSEVQLPSHVEDDGPAGREIDIYNAESSDASRVENLLGRQTSE